MVLIWKVTLREQATRLAAKALLKRTKERRRARTCAGSRRPIRAFSFQSAATHRAVSATFRRTITKPRKSGSLTSPRLQLNRHSLPGAKPGFNYEVEHHPAFNGGPALVIRTNADGAEDFIPSEFIRG